MYKGSLRNCQFREFAPALLGRVHFLSSDQQSGIHCLIICAIQLLTPNNIGGTWRHICSRDIRNVSALEVLPNRALQIDIYLLTYFWWSLEYLTWPVSTGTRLVRRKLATVVLPCITSKVASQNLRIEDYVFVLFITLTVVFHSWKMHAYLPLHWWSSHMHPLVPVVAATEVLVRISVG